MKYKELKELKFEEWDGKPFRAIVTDDDDDDDNTLSLTDKRRYDGIEEGVLITGYDNERWLSNNSFRWNNVYPIECNKKPKKRMTNRQLSMWLAKGNGEYSNSNLRCAYNHYQYGESEANNFVDVSFRVRKWDSEEWVEPTTDLLEDC